jgi:hypothetical protein
MQYEIQYDAASGMYLVFKIGSLTHIAKFTNEEGARLHVETLINSL